jgi:hypothetical protein
MNATAFQPPIVTTVLNSREVERAQVNGQRMTIYEEEALDIIDQRWLLVVCESDGVRDVTGWTYLERVKSDV